ncbi:MAG: F0F1 ATP synthase subunit delta [Firmicutes bacterium]|nr:F0F1 ATP synthase subunit delta [Bacillota bacterium]
MDSIITKRYARAYYELAQEKSAQEAFSKDSALLQEVFAQNAELCQLLSAPGVSAEQKGLSVKRIFGQTCSEDTIGLLQLLIRKGRIGYLEEILKEYDRMAKEARGEVVAEVRCAVALSEKQQNKIQTMLTRKLGKKVSLDIVVDASLIGGMVVRIGDQVYDNSIRTRMEKMRVHLENVHLGDTEKVG